MCLFLLGLDKAAKSPYDGWKTNSFVQCGSPENEYVLYRVLFRSVMFSVLSLLCGHRR